MSRTRPINRRPWKRNPFRKSSRAKRWLDCNSAVGLLQADGDCNTSGILLPCSAVASSYSLLYGDTDWDWADDSEVLIERIVGTLSLFASIGTPAIEGGHPKPLVFRLGFLACEELEDGTQPALDLWDPEALEEYQWMWLKQLTVGDVSGGNFRGAKDVDIDLRNRRKLGKRDGIYLYIQWKAWAPTASLNGTSIYAGAMWQFRSMVTTK